MTSMTTRIRRFKLGLIIPPNDSQVTVHAPGVWRIVRLERGICNVQQLRKMGLTS